ncbi:Transformer-2 protein alpha [Coemansia sp. RSA 988]|nr:Transformer-2 protein alpha [Coemansia sp. RSA 988]
MSKENPILPSEPLSLQPKLMASAVVEGLEGPTEPSRQLSPRSAERVRRRMDIRNYGRSESHSRSVGHEPGKSNERPEHYSTSQTHYVSQQRRSIGPTQADQTYHKHDGRSLSPRYSNDRRDTHASSTEYGRSDNRNNHSGHRLWNGDNQSYRSIFYLLRNGSDENHRQGEPAPCRVLGIFQMSKFTNEDHLQEIFGRYGPIETIQVIRDPHDGRSRRFGFVNMENVADAQRARDALTNTLIHDRKVRVDFSFTPKTHGSMQGRSRARNTSPHGHRRHFERNHYHNDGYFRAGPSHFVSRRSNAPYHPRRRANTRDRRRRDQQHDHPQHDHYEGRSRSPGYHSGAKRHDSYHRDSYYAEPRDNREYEEGRGTNSHGFSRSSQGSYGRDYGYERGCSHGQRNGNGNELQPPPPPPPPPPPLSPQPRSSYRSKMSGNPLY